MKQGFLILMLHAHLPWVKHAEHKRSLEEAWLYEAASETYIPFLDMLERINSKGLPGRITLSLSPTLLDMLGDRFLISRLDEYLERQVALANSEVRRTVADPSFGPAARMYAERSEHTLKSYRDIHESDLRASFRRVAKMEHTELLTTAATHAYLPNISPFSDAVKTQIGLGLSTFEKFMGIRPKGIWLPECGYYDGLDRLLGDVGVEYFVADAHGLMHASPRPAQGVYRPVRTPGGPAVFGRDTATVMKVWNSAYGYPGDPAYRDFYRDIGHELPLDYIGPYLHPEGIRGFTGFKYYRITGNTAHKAPYAPDAARAKAKEHAAHFIRHIESLASNIHNTYGFRPVITIPFDAELFGHWWFEGIWWLEAVLNALATSNVIESTTPSEYLAVNPELRTATLTLSSWGEGGYSQTWSQGRNTVWLDRMTRSTALMESLLASLEAGESPAAEALRLATAELLMAQASDWTFMLNKGPFSGYARNRLQTHLDNTDALMRMAVAGNVDHASLKRINERTPAFAREALDYWRSLA